MKRKIIAHVWKHPAQQGRIVGIVAAVTEEHKLESMRTWCAYIGIINMPLNEENDAKVIAELGAKLSAHEAQGFFPQLNIKEYKEAEKQ